MVRGGSCNVPGLHKHSRAGTCCLGLSLMHAGMDPPMLWSRHQERNMVRAVCLPSTSTQHPFAACIIPSGLPSILPLCAMRHAPCCHGLSLSRPFLPNRTTYPPFSVAAVAPSLCHGPYFPGCSFPPNRTTYPPLSVAPVAPSPSFPHHTDSHHSCLLPPPSPHLCAGSIPPITT